MKALTLHYFRFRTVRLCFWLLGLSTWDRIGIVAISKQKVAARVPIIALFKLHSLQANLTNHCWFQETPLTKK